MHKALFLDLDGTVRKTKSGKVAPSDHKDQVVLPGRTELIKKYKDDGFKIIAVTNQAGISKGYLTHEQCKACLFHLNQELGMPFDDMLYEPSDDPKHPRRKPNPGMLQEAAEKHNIDLGKSLMVGDMSTDRDAAKSAGVPYMDASEFFKKNG